MLILLLTTLLAYGDPSVDDLIAKHVQAIGGAESWAKVKTMKLTGDYEAFSSVNPFTLYRSRPNHYRFEHVMVGTEVVRAYDGKMAWQSSPRGSGPIPEPQNKVTIYEADFESPLLNHQEKGHQVKFMGEENVEGEDHYKLELTFKDGRKETWFLNKQTYLLTLMQGQTYEYGQPKTLEVFYGEYSKVQGVMIPHYVDLQWHTRHRIFTVASVEINQGVDEKLYTMPQSGE